MMGLVLKDILNLKKQAKLFALLVVIYFVISCAQKSMSFLMGLASVMLVMLPITALAYDERSHFEKYALTMPISRKDLVMSKYMLGLILSLLSIAINFLANIIGYFFINIPVGSDAVYSTLIMFCISIAFLSVMLPINFKLGVEKARYALMIVVVIPTVIALVMSKNKSAAASFISKLESIGMTNIMFMLFLLSAVILVISIIISLNIYKKKEF